MKNGSNPNGSDYSIIHYKNAKGFIRWKRQFFWWKESISEESCNEVTPGSLKSSAACKPVFNMWGLPFFLRLKVFELVISFFLMAKEKIRKWDIKNATYWFENENWIFWRFLFSLPNCFSSLFSRTLKPMTFHPLESQLKYLTWQHIIIDIGIEKGCLLSYNALSL